MTIIGLVDGKNSSESFETVSKFRTVRTVIFFN